MVRAAISIPGVEVLDELGRGAHSAVYRVRRGGRFFAAKVPIYDGLEEPPERIAQRFLREAVALARVRHPALPSVMEVGRTGDLPYIIMELAAGETLSERLRQGPLDEEQVSELSVQLAEALVRIHASGVLHRDIKTANVLFDSQTTAVRLVDFGFAASPNRAPCANANPDDVSVAFHQPPFADARADLFALGAVLFECVTGLALQNHPDPGALLERHADNVTTSPRITRQLARILRRLLGADGEEGYTDASSLLEDLRALRDFGPSSGTTRPRVRMSASLPLFGRERELERLRAAWRASSASRAQVVLLRGGRGAGKTRLMRAFLEELGRDGQRSFSVSCEATQKEPFGAIRRMLEAELDEHERLAPKKRLQAIANFRNLAGEAAPFLRMLSPRLARLFPDAAALPRVDGLEHIFSESLAALLGRLLNERGKTTVAVDDLQWIDAGSRRVLLRLTDQPSRVLYLLCARDDAESWPTIERFLRSLDSERLWELTLESFDETRNLELMQAYLGQDRLHPELVRCVVGLSDGTPLSTLETVRSMLDGGVLLPHWGEWQFDGEAARRMGLPRGSLELLTRRIAELDPECVELLTFGAVIGMSFDDSLSAHIAGTEPGRAATLFGDARRAMLIEAFPGAKHRFVHDAVREALLARLEPAGLSAFHQRVAEALEETQVKSTSLERTESGTQNSSSETQQIFRSLESDAANEDDETSLATNEMTLSLASHYLDGERDKNPLRVLQASTRAARLAFHRFDHQLALKFFQGAEKSAEAAEVPLDLGFELLYAEALLRAGATETATARLRAIERRAEEPATRAYALYRVSWAEMQLDVKRAWGALEEAFRALGVRPPTDSAWMLVPSVLSWLYRSTFRLKRITAPEEQRRVAVLCALYYQAGRLAFHEGKPLRMVQSALRGLLPAERLGSSSALSRAYLSYSAVLAGVGRQKLARRWLSRAEDVARTAKNPIDYAHALQTHCAIAGIAGNLRETLEVGTRLLNEYGNFRELSEYCMMAYQQQTIESLRGRNLEAWRWLERAVAKLSKHDGLPTALEFIELSVRAVLLAIGRRHESELILARLIDRTARPSAPGTVIMRAYGSRARLFTESGNLDEAFEALVLEARANAPDPRRVPVEMLEYYVHVAHARAHECLRAETETLPRKLEVFTAAISDLRLAARMPLLKAHLCAVEAYFFYLTGEQRKAEASLRRAEQLGIIEGAPWVLYAVHRCRAHMLSRAGNLDASRDEARIAEALAREHGAAYRLRWIREEFSLRIPQPGIASSPSSPSEAYTPGDTEASVSRRPRGYLRSFVRLGACTAKELELSVQVRAVLDELIEMSRADRGFLFLTRERLRVDKEFSATVQAAGDGEPDSDGAPAASMRDRLVLIAARGAAGNDLSSPRGYDPRLVEDVTGFGLLESADESGAGRVGFLTTYGDRAVVVAGLVVRSERIGVLYLDRPLRVGSFLDSDARQLSALAIQVPLVFELARSLRAREELEETQRSTEKLEAIARLAGGIAHDFNNMLSVILAASEQILSQRSTRSVSDDIKTIQSAAERARDLTRQLLAFSRGQYLNPEVLELNQLVLRLEPIFRRLLSESTSVELELEPALCRVKADPAQIDQVLTNLVVNAGDAMASGGRLSIRTDNVTVPLERSSGSRALPEGRYARLLISDTGKGMDEVTRAKAFEPFFTTKETGSGLGLATAYGIVTQSGGHIEIDSEPGVGTTFRIYLPETGQPAPIPTTAHARGPVPRGTETILLVDDEPLVRESTRRMLSSLGYIVITAKNSEDALGIANERLDSIDLVISDVIMPGMNGLELARELSRRRPTVKVLFVSGYTAGVLAERGVLKESVAFLEKPIALETLAPRLRNLLEEKRA